GRLRHHRALHFELGERARVIRMDRAVELHHREGDLGLDLAGNLRLRQPLDQVAGLVREVAIVRAHELQLDFDPETKALRTVEKELSHLKLPSGSGCSSPACLSANWVATGPMSSSSATAESTTAASSPPKRGNRTAVSYTMTTARPDMGSSATDSRPAPPARRPDSRPSNRMAIALPRKRATMNTAESVATPGRVPNSRLAPASTKNTTKSSWPAWPKRSGNSTWS